ATERAPRIPQLPNQSSAEWSSQHNLRPLRPRLLRFKSEQIARRTNVVKAASDRLAEGVDHGEAIIHFRRDGTGEETASIAWAQVDILRPLRRGDFLDLFLRS